MTTLIALRSTSFIIIHLTFTLFFSFHLPSLSTLSLPQSVLQIITSPMDLMRIEKKNAGDKYSSVASILEDMNLLKSNAYLYNQGMTESYLLFSSLSISCTFPVNLSHSRIYFAVLSLSMHHSTPLACAYLPPSLYFYLHLGVNGLEVRIMADALVNYFRHLLRRSLSDLLTKTNSVKGTMNQTQIQARTKSV
jgi:Bromodomain